MSVHGPVLYPTRSFLQCGKSRAGYRILKAEGLGHLPPADRARRSHSRFKEYDLGFVHMDVKHLPKLRTQDGQSRKRYLYVASDRASRFVHLAVKDDEPRR